MPCPGQNPLPAPGLDAYTEANIQVLSGLDVIRRRPAMFVGSTDEHGLFHLLLELVASSLAEAVAGFGNSVRVTLREDGSAEVADDGRTLPDGDSVEQVFASYGPGHHGYRPYNPGRDYLPYVFANALAERFTVFVRGDRSVYQHAFRQGVTHAVLQSGGPPGDRGLTVRFLPDPQIFGAATFDSDVLRERFRQLAFLHSGVRVSFTDEAAGTHDEFEYSDGIREYVQALNAGRSHLHTEVIVLRGDEEGVRYDVGLQWCGGDELRQSFANGYPTPQGGTHEVGLLAGVALGLRDFMRARGPLPGEFKSEDFRAGLTGVVAVWLGEPTFESRTRMRLNNPEAEAVVKDAVRGGVRRYFEANQDYARRVVDAVSMARDFRVAARAAREQARKKSGGA